MASPREEGELLESSSSSSDEEDSDEEKSGNQGPSAVKFKNDGSFMEMFKKMQESSQTLVPDETLHKEELVKDAGISSSAEKCLVKKEEDPAAASTSPKPGQQKKPGLMSIVGKRRGGKSLPVGVVKKQKRPEEEESSGKTDAWSQYMSEVKKYKERLGDEEEKNRPLVK